MSGWLAIDTATAGASVALVDGGVLAERSWHGERNHTVELAPAVADVLRLGDRTARDLDGIAVAIGPGSYTGLRVGLALAKGIVLVSGTPIVAVPTLHVLAAALSPPAAPRDELLHAFLQAGRRRYAIGAYGRDPLDWPDPATLRAWTIDAFLETFRPPACVAGEIAIGDAERLADAGFRVVPPVAALRRAAHLAALGACRFGDGAADAAGLVPVYLGRGPE